ncbi:MAG: (Fe-S)-binding protein, partial [Bacteroidia bacterium]|nr:(Fe-S)-binding protein [Bacteroidia bacterium]
QENAFNCLLCGRCSEYCHVGIDTNSLRMAHRQQIIGNNGVLHNYDIQLKANNVELVYYAGCMTHLTPAIKKAMVAILNASGLKYSFIDSDGTLCCGRPMMLAGRYNEANHLISANTKIIKSYGASRLVTSCPICYKIFREEYQLGMEVIHHTQFILELIVNKKININHTNKILAYHDPCELGRGGNIYEAPRAVLNEIGRVKEYEFNRNQSFCCGGSLGNIQITINKRELITSDVLNRFTTLKPDILVTACPLCKKTLMRYSAVPVKDIAEVAVYAIDSSLRSE